jgi:hypothetical protein
MPPRPVHAIVFRRMDALILDDRACLSFAGDPEIGLWMNAVGDDEHAIREENRVSRQSGGHRSLHRCVIRYQVIGCRSIIRHIQPAPCACSDKANNPASNLNLDPPLFNLEIRAQNLEFWNPGHLRLYPHLFSDL